MDHPIIARKQFIAGAVCPSCNEVDRIVVETVNETEESPALNRRRCVQCGFADEFRTHEQALSGSIPKGRPERPRSASTQASVVRILNPPEEPDNSP